MEGSGSVVRMPYPGQLRSPRPDPSHWNKQCSQCSPLSSALDTHKRSPHWRPWPQSITLSQSRLGNCHNLLSQLTSLKSFAVIFGNKMVVGSAIPENRILPAKDASNFRGALKLYESKQYKKALKGVEGILKKHPDHGETLALKGLSLYFLQKKDEGLECIKRGVANDPTSFVAWHIFGIYWRYEHNYDEALKCYSRAAQLDGQNFNVLRDLAVLQTIQGQYDQLVVSRQKILNDKPGFRQNWTSLAMAQYFAKQYSAAESTLSRFEEVLNDTLKGGKTLPRGEAFEHSEVSLFKNLVIYKSGDVKRALEHLNECESNGSITDKLLIMEKRYEYLTELGDSAGAQKQIRALVRRNPYSKKYLTELENTLKIDSLQSREALYVNLAAKYPSSFLIQMTPLEFLPATTSTETAKFIKAAKPVLEKLLERGVPAAFSLLKPLLSDAGKRAAILKIVSEAPTSIWTEYFKAQFASYDGDDVTALNLIDKCISQDSESKNLEFVVTKARFYKHAGDLQKAAEIMDDARAKDKSDRFVNTKAGKYWLRANNVEKAIEVISLFTKNDYTGKGVNDLVEMQGLWFLIELAECHARRGEIALALKRFHNVMHIFKEYYRDQFDFHYYAPRRGTIHAYLDMISWSNNVYKHPTFARAVEGALKVYSDIDAKQKADRLLESTLSAAELKSFNKKKAKEEKLLIEAEEKEVEQAQAALAASPDAKLKPSVDTDPLGLAFSRTKTPLEDIYNEGWLLLKKYAADRLKTWQLGYEIFVRQNKPVLAVQAITKSKQLGASQSWVATSVVRLKAAMDKDSVTPAVIKQQIEKKTLPSLVGTEDLTLSNSVNPNADLDSLLNWVSATVDVGGNVGPQVIEFVKNHKVSGEDVLKLSAIVKSNCSKDEYAKLSTAVHLSHPLVKLE